MKLTLAHEMKYRKLVFKSKITDIEFDKLQLVGRNGSGKSTLIKMIEKNIIKLNTNKKVILKQEVILFPNLNIKDNIELQVENWKKVYEKFINYFPGISEKRKVKALSGGQKQVLNVLIALSMEGDVYIFDEPFNNIDKAKQEMLYQEFEELKSPLIIVAHGYKLPFCFSTLTIEKGELIYEKKI